MGRQALERQKGSKRYDMERELTAVTEELCISGAGLFCLICQIIQGDNP